MKKIMISLLCIISLLLSIAFAYSEKARDEQYLDNIEMTKNAIPFFVKDSALSIEEELSEFTKLAKKYQVTIIRTDNLTKNHKQIVYKSGIYAKDYFKKLKIKLVNGRMPQEKDEFLATYDTKNKKQSGKIHDLFTDQPLIFGPLKNFYQKNNNNISVNGTYTLIVKPKYKEAVLKQLSVVFKIAKAKLITPTYGKGYGEGTIYLLASIFSIIILAIFCLMSAFYPISKLKEIGIMKLLGFKSLNIWGQLNNRILMTAIFFFLLTLPLQKIIISESDWPYFLKLTVLELIILAICLLFSMIMLVIIRKFKLADVLKNFFNFRFSLYLSYLLKFLIFVALIATIPLMSKELKILLQELQVKEVYEQEKNYLTLAKLIYKDNEFQEELNGNDIVRKKLFKLYKELEKTASAQYIVVHGGRLDEKDVKKDAYLLMEANQNYLKKLNFNLPLSLSKLFSGTEPTYLVPISFKKERDKVESFVRFKGVIHKDIPVQMIFYQDNDKEFFSENIDKIDQNRGFIKNPIILCLSDNFLNERNSRLTVSALRNPLRILDNKKNRVAIQQAIISNGLENNDVQFKNVLSTGFARELNIAQTSVIAWISILSLSLLTSILASFYIILIILTSKRKEMLVTRLLGYSFFERYRNEIFCFCAIYFFGLVEILILNSHMIALTSYLVLILIDILIIYLMVKKHEKSSLSLALKGEEG
ncbi:MAG: DUF1430 domain-containing protein [Streptococcaceae bacterium]|nr:DUF1430 domain-containing protein [Streptococcaceae bacterium]